MSAKLAKVSPAGAEGWRWRRKSRKRKAPLAAWRFTDGFLLIEHEFLGVQQRPDDVLVGDLLFLFVLGDLGQGHLELFRARLVGKGPVEELFDLLGFRTRVLGQG